MIVTGQYRNNVIIPDRQISLPDGIKVDIVIPDYLLKRSRSGLCGIWQDKRDAKQIVDEVIKARSKGREIDL